MTAIAGLRGTGDWAVDERPKNFREYILFRNPNGTAPLFAMTAKTKKESVDDPEFSWWDEPNDIVRLHTTPAYVAGDTTITVDSADPGNTPATANNNWGLATHLKAGDHLLVEPLADAATFAHEVIEVVSVTSPTVLVVSRGAQGTTPAAIPANSYLLKIGSAYAEGTPEPKATSRNPVKYSNFTQIFKDSYELTGTAEQTKTRTGDPVKNDKKRKAFDHARDIEFSMIFGQKSETVGSNGKPKRTMAGIRSFIPPANTKIFTVAPTINTLLDAISPVFNWDSESGDTRVAFAGNGALNAFNKIIANAPGVVKIEFKGDAKWFGMTFNEYRMPQGTLLIKTHPLFNRHSLYTNSMLIIDQAAIRYRPLKNRDTKMKDDVQNKGEDVRRGFWQTEAGIEVRYGGLTMGYIGAINTGITTLADDTLLLRETDEEFEARSRREYEEARQRREDAQERRRSVTVSRPIRREAGQEREDIFGRQEEQNQRPPSERLAPQRPPATPPQGTQMPAPTPPRNPVPPQTPQRPIVPPAPPNPSGR